METGTTWETVKEAPGAWIITHVDYFGNRHQVWLTREDAQKLAQDILSH